METKEMIQEAALDLFSQKGFDSSSVRDIAAKVGIKDSSLYFHFKNKQAILDSLMNKFIHISEQMMSSVSNGIEDITAIDDEDFYAVTEQYIRSYFMDRFIGRFIMVMNHERSHNEQLRKHYISWCIKKPIEFQMTVMKRLQDIGYLKSFDARHISLEYYASIFLYFNQYMNHNYTDSDKEAFLNAVMTETKNFIKIYKEEK